MAILNYLHHDTHGVDLHDVIPAAERYIIATPTGTHLDILSGIIEKYGIAGDLSILIEKPVTKRPELLGIVAKTKNKVWMVNQYAYAKNGRGMYLHQRTGYDYFNSGDDGLAWDCIQLIHLAKGPIVLKNESPRRLCTINGNFVPLDMVDDLYVRMIKDFIGDNQVYGKLWGPEDIIAAHEKVLAYEKGDYRSAGQIGIDTPEK
jgi:hypothetical protein